MRFTIPLTVDKRGHRNKGHRYGGAG